jgi:drug/metabolite transporter (DMT)-like permease
MDVFATLALGSAALYGAADFIGGMTAKRADTMAVVVVSQSAGLLLVAFLLAVLGTELPPRADWIWGSAAGIAGGAGVALLYRALAIGVMSLVAPVTAVCAVAVPVIVAIALLGEIPSLLAGSGIALALLAIVLVSQSDHIVDVASSINGTSAALQTTGAQRRGLGLALASGVAIGLFFLALARTSADAGLWPLLFARASSVTLFGVLLMVSGRPIRMPAQVAATAIAGGLIDMLANLLYLLASRRGPLTLVVTLSSLYPASTVLLARYLLHERLNARQWAGVALALIAILMIVTE